METNSVKTQWTDESVVDLVRKLRNDLIKDFLDERFLKEYIDAQFRVKALSNIKVELIKKDLKELLISPVDLHHYNTLITQIKYTDSAALTETNERLFYKEIEFLLKRYFY